jgi:hypothetical protein
MLTFKHKTTNNEKITLDMQLAPNFIGLQENTFGYSTL